MTDKENSVLPEEVVESLLTASAGVVPDADRADRMKMQLLNKVRETKPSSADEFVTVPDASDEWIETGPGNWIKVLRSDSETMSMLVRLSPGSTFPQHYHPHDEETYVVDGETWFGDIHLKAGDYHLAPKGTTHGEVRTDTGCVLLIRKAAD